MSDMASNTPFPQFKTTGDDKHDVEVYIEDLIDYCIMQNWFDSSKETEAAKWTKPEKAMACLRASLSPAARAVYKYSLGLSEQDQSKPHMVINALKEYYGASIGVSGERQKFLSLLQNEEKSIASWETRIRNQAAQCEYENFADELMRDQFIAGLTSEPLRVKLIGKGHRHRDVAQSKVTLREVVEVAKSHEATSFANQLMKNARGIQQEQVNFTKKTTSENRNSDTSTAACFWCRGDHPSPRQQHCPAFGKRCNKCGIIGHFARACRGGTRTGRRRQHQSNFVSDDPTEEAFVVNCQATQIGAKKFFAHLHLIHEGQSKTVRAQIDSASTCNTMPSSVLKQLFPNVKISKTKSRITTYGSQTMKPKGQVTLVCERKGRLHTIDFLMVDVSGDKPPLLSGRDAQALKYLTIYADETNAVEETTQNSYKLPALGKLTSEDILNHYSNVFKPGRGKPLGSPMHIDLDPSVTPVHAPTRRVPVAKLDRVNEELKRLCEEGIVRPVTQPTDWLSNMLIKEKPNGKLRICIDPSQTINKAIKRPKYTIPTIEERLPRLTKAKVFTVVDVSEAFHTIELDEESSLLTTFRGPDGRYCYNRMPFGIASGPEEYQRRQHEFLDGLNGVINIADDICVYGCGDTKEEADIDHDRNLIHLLEKCSDHDLRLSARKIQFKSRSVSFMGHRLTNRGVQPDPSKVAAITGMPTPVDLTRDDTEFLWSDVHEAAFNSAKTLITSTTALRYYDVSLPVTLQVDASDSAIGGVLLQEGHPVCFTSHTLSATEKNYAQIEKECLAIVSCMEKWHHYLYGKQDITVHSDHQPLETIFKKPLSRAPRRLQRMMLRLQNYHFTVQYKKGKELFVADTLSRAALSDVHGMTQEYDVFRVDLAQMDLSPNLVKPGTMSQIREETVKDPSLMTLKKVVLGGWPSQKSEVPDEIRAYWDFRDEISVYDGVLFKSHQVIVPASLRSELLQKIHKAHQGADSSIRRARESVYWPGMQAAIRQTCFSCGVCSQYLSERPQEPMQSHTIPSRPWERVSADLFQLDGSNYLVLVDHYSDYFKLEPLRNTSAVAVIRAMKRNFARHGIPNECVTDNGPQFVSHEYARFAREYGFTSIKSSPYHSKGNGKAESAVKIAKNILKKFRFEDPYLALLAYRNTPQQGY